MKDIEIIKFVVGKLRDAIDDDLIKRQEVIDTIGVSRNQLGKWLDGTYVPGAENFIGLCRLLKVDISALMFECKNEDLTVLQITRELEKEDAKTLREFAKYLYTKKQL